MEMKDAPLMPLVRPSVPLFWYHVLAVLTVAIWGTTFIATKLLIEAGLSPASIMLLRFLIAYICIWPFTRRSFFASTLKDEFLFLLAGLSGGSLYFLAENTALSYSLASNVSLLVCTAPLLTALLFLLFRKGERFRIKLFWGSIVAFSGVALVIYSGGTQLKLNPIGDFLALGAAFMWAIYSLVIKGLNGRYSSLFLTRKVFFYGILTVLPFVLMQSEAFDYGLLLKPKIAANLLFLGVVASMLCFHTWNIATHTLGVVRTTNYIYFTPLVALLGASLFLGEVLPLAAFGGAILIVAGLYLAK